MSSRGEKTNKQFFSQNLRFDLSTQKTDWKTDKRSLSCVPLEKGDAKFTRLLQCSKYRNKVCKRRCLINFLEVWSVFANRIFFYCTRTQNVWFLIIFSVNFTRESIKIQSKYNYMKQVIHLVCWNLYQESPE